MDVKSLTLDGLEYFKGKQDAYNDSKFATKASVPTKTSQLQNDSTYQTKSEMDTAISDAVNTALAAVMTYKGTKDTAGDLPMEDNKLGDVWHVTADAAEYAWDGTKWEALGSTMGISVDWGSITGKPSEFTPAAHVHDDATTDAAGFMSAEDKAKLDGIAAGANNYAHPSSPAGAKAAGLYKVATDASGHVTEATAVAKYDIDALGVISVPAGGTEGQFVQSKSGQPVWADGIYLSDDKIMSGAAEVDSVSVNGGGSKVELIAGEDAAIQITGAEDKVLPIGIAGGKSAVGLGQSPIDYIYVADADVASANGKLAANVSSVKAYVDSKTVVDASLSDSSVNPVQNKVIKAALDGKSAAGHTHTIDNVTGLQDALDDKADAAHTHNYAGSASPGGSANSAVKLDTSAGTATQPIYFSGGKPVTTTYSLSASVPADAKFTDTTYEDATTSQSGLMSSSDKTKLDGLDKVIPITNQEIDEIFN